MKTTILLYNAEKEKSFFSLERGTRPWGILLMITRGSFEVCFPDSGFTQIIYPYEIAYFPPYTEFVRRVQSPIDFYQITFQSDQSHPICQALPRGKLNIPSSQTRAFCEIAERMLLFPACAEKLNQHLLHSILITNHLYTGNATGDSFKLSREITDALHYIGEHLSEEIRISAVAEQVHLSHTGLIWKFKKELGITPSDYIIQLRIKHAKQLLLEDTRSISEIATACGYANAYYFSNAFKRLEGMSPSAFRMHASAEPVKQG